MTDRRTNDTRFHGSQTSGASEPKHDNPPGNEVKHFFACYNEKYRMTIQVFRCHTPSELMPFVAGEHLEFPDTQMYERNQPIDTRCWIILNT